MTKSLFRQSFLFDSLDTAQPMATAEFTTSQGVALKVLQHGILEVIPAQQDSLTRNIVFSCGIHGDETAPMELIDKLIDDIISGDLPVRERCLFIMAHPEATKRAVRYVEENLNRLFDDRTHPQTTEARIAASLKSVVNLFFEGTQPESRWHIDLHCAIRNSRYYAFAVSPKVRHPVRSRALMEFLASAHVEAILLSNAPASTFSWYSAEHFSAQAVTLELGQVARVGENNQKRMVGADLAMRDLIGRSQAEHLPKNPVIYRVSRTIVRLHDDFGFMFGDDVENFTTFMHGEVFGHDGDKPLMAKNDEEAIVFPNPNVEVGQRAALMVCKVLTRYEDDQLVYD